MSLAASRRHTATYAKVNEALKQGRLRAGMPVARLLALGTPLRVTRLTHFVDYGYAYYHVPEGISGGMLVQTYRGRLLLHRTTWGSYKGCRTHMPQSHFDAATVAQKKRYTFLVARHQCAKTPADWFACNRLAQAYADGSGTPRDTRRARVTLARACRHGQKDLCYKLAQWLLSGRLGSRERPAAKRFLSRACKLEHDLGCLLLWREFPETKQPRVSPPTRRPRRRRVL